MSQWHREHPELAGTDADPWMQNEGYRQARAEVQEIEREVAFEREFGVSLDRLIEEYHAQLCVCGHRLDRHDGDPDSRHECDFPIGYRWVMQYNSGVGHEVLTLRAIRCSCSEFEAMS